MLTQRLSGAALKGVGAVLPSAQDAAANLHRHALTLRADEPARLFTASDTWVLDYESDMALLALYDEDGCAARSFYLDRAVALYPGVRFAVVPLRGTCGVALYTPSEEPPLSRALPDAAAEFGYSTSLKLERLYTFFYQESASNFYFRGEQHEPYELVYVDRGALHNVIGGADILLSQQSLLIIDRDNWHMQYAEEGVCFLTLSFSLKEGALPPACLNRRFALNARMKPLVGRLMGEREAQGPYFHDYAESLLQILLIELARCAEAEGGAAGDRPALPSTERAGEAILDRALQIISENIGGRLSLEALASELFVSVSYLTKLFHAQLGMPPGKYITRIRLEECKALLRDQSMPVGEVSRRMGFSSVQHFSKQFRRCFGISPTEYLKMLR